MRVMVVDDSIVARSLNARWLQDEPDLDVVAVCRSGREAVDRIGDAKPDVIVLDVEMPDMDGLEALPLLLRARRHVAVLIASSHTTKGADLSVRCLALGAADILPKPAQLAGSAEYHRDLVEKVRTLGPARRRRVRSAHAEAVTEPARQSVAERRSRMGALVVGASTGGPQALRQILMAAKPALGGVPTLICQHMPAGFTTALADQLSTATGLDVHEAQDGEIIVPGSVYLAPGGRHFSVERVKLQVVARLDDGPRINFCKPSVDPLFRSAAKVYGAGLVAAVLTGMGSDGAASVAEIAAAGGIVIAQDEATSTVWGMPGAAVATGACSVVLPLPEIGTHIARYAHGDRT